MLIGAYGRGWGNFLLPPPPPAPSQKGMDMKKFLYLAVAAFGLLALACFGVAFYFLTPFGHNNVSTVWPLVGLGVLMVAITGCAAAAAVACP